MMMSGKSALRCVHAARRVAPWFFDTTGPGHVTRYGRLLRYVAFGTIGCKTATGRFL
jgi:hypothetical protein